MKRTIAFLLAAVTAAICAVITYVTTAPKAEALEVTFNYEVQKTHGSNQFAVWVENEQGEVVKTLFVTAFTARGRVREGEPRVRGYIRRPYCVPTWVKDAKAEDMSDQQMDAISGATPSESGRQTFTWDFTDTEGRKVRKGNYRIFVEATLFDPSTITYSGTFSTKGKPGEEVTFSSTITQPCEEREGMVTDVKAVLK